jgi:hypothetical protein
VPPELIYVFELLAAATKTSPTTPAAATLLSFV